MKRCFLALLSGLHMMPIYAQTMDNPQPVTRSAVSGKIAASDIARVSPALEQYTSKILINDLWKRPGLSPRDRSIVTVAAVIARDQTSGMKSYIELALDNGVTPAEISEIITHLAFYSGWPNAMSAVAVTKEIFSQRHIGIEQLPKANGPLLPIDLKSEAERAKYVAENVGAISPGLEHYTSDPLFHDLWLRKALSPRDRSLVTVSALIASGQVAQLAAHLNRAMDNGLTRAQVSEMLTQLPFYTGWPNVFSAVPIVRQVLEKRAEPS